MGGCTAIEAGDSCQTSNMQAHRTWGYPSPQLYVVVGSGRSLVLGWCIAVTQLQMPELAGGVSSGLWWG